MAAARADLTVCLLIGTDPGLAPARDRARASVAFAGEVREVEGTGRERGPRLRDAIAAARFPFVLILSEEEAVSPELATEFESLLARGPAAPAYRVLRRGRYLGRPVHCPEWQGAGPLRFLDRRGPFAIDPERGAITVPGTAGELAGELECFSPLSLGGMIQEVALATRGTTGGPPPVARLFTAPMIELWRSFWRRGGVRGGRASLFLATMDSFYVLVGLARRFAAPATDPRTSPSKR